MERNRETDPEIIPAWIADIVLMSFRSTRKLLSFMQTKWSMATYASTSTSPSGGKKRRAWLFLWQGSVVFIEGVVPATSTAIQAFTKERGCCLNQYQFHPHLPEVSNSIRKLTENSLVEKDRSFSNWFWSAGKRYCGAEVKLYVLCNHTILEAVYGIVKSWKKSATFVKSMVSFSFPDEIHRFGLFGHRHTSFNTVDQALKISVDLI